MNIIAFASSSNDFPFYWLFFAGGAVFLVVAIVFFIMAFKGKKGEAKNKIASKSEYIEALGGEANIISHKRKGSRIEIALSDYSKLDKEKLKEAGVASFLLMSDKLTLVIKGDAEKVEKIIFGA